MNRISGRAGPYPGSNEPTPAADHARGVVHPTPLAYADAAEIERRFTRLSTTGDLHAEPLVPPEVGDHAIALAGHTEELERMLDEMGRFAQLAPGVIREVKGMVEDAVRFAQAKHARDPLGAVRDVALELGADPALYDRVAEGVRVGRVDETSLNELIIQMSHVSEAEAVALVRAMGIGGGG